jgi:hypothetical protein
MSETLQQCVMSRHVEREQAGIMALLRLEVPG